MYVRTKNVAWWVDPTSAHTSTTGTPLSPDNAEALDLTAHLPDRKTRWANQPLKLHLATYALRAEDRLVRVYAQHKGKRGWLPVSALMGEDQVRQWLGDGFVRMR